MLSQGEDLATEFLNYLRAADRPVSDLMMSPVVTVSESTSVQTIVEMLQKQHIKRVPVLRDGRLVGTVCNRRRTLTPPQGHDRRRS